VTRKIKQLEVEGARARKLATPMILIT